MFIYEFLRPHLYWPFSSEQTVYLEHLQQLFKIQSLSGNGQFRVEKVNIANSSFSVGQGNKASSFYLLQNLEFYKTHFDLFEGTQKGSVIYIDCTNSFNISVEIRNISIRSIYSSEKGGFLYLDQVKGSIEVNLEEVQLIDVFSIQGSIIYFSGLNTKQKIKIISLTNIYFISSQEGYTNFTIWYNYYTQHQKNLLNQQINLIQISGNRSLIYICQASILRIKNLQIQNLFFEKVIELQNVNKIQFTEMFIYKSFFSDTCILIAPIEASPAQIVIENIKIMEVLFGCFVFDNPILEMIYPKTVRNNCLNNENPQAPSLMKIFFTNVTTFYRQRNQSILTSCQANNIFQGLINFQQFSQIHQLKFDNFQITNVNCLSCQNGLLSFNFTKQTSQLKKQLINNLIIVNSLCGFRGCLKISVSQLEKQANSTKYKQDIQNVEIDISNYICQYNQAENGTCLYLEQVRIILSSCDFRYNIARSVGGAIYSKKSSIQVQLILQSTQISENVASIGGGIFMEEQLEMNFLKFDSIVNDNKAELFANDILAIPAQLLIQINGIQEEIFELFSIVQNKTFSLFMQKLKKEISIHGFLTNYTLLPNGISIAEYKYFDWRKRIYTQFNQTFRILALTQTGVQMKNLKNSFCLIQSRTLDNTSDVSIKSYTNNFTNIQRVYFDEETQDYNLDNLVIYNRDDTKIQQTVELQFWCNSIHVPVYNVSFPYNLISQHDQYYLRIQINTYPCQIGEIRNETFQYCQVCNWKEGFFQLKLNQIKCQIRDEISTSEIQPALLKVRTGFWRPYFDTSQIAHCKNSPQNCQGGWMEGDTSCFYGYIGALCEQCDIHNVRGQGEYSKYLKNTCKTCENSFKSYFSSTLSLLWTFFLTSVSAYGSIQSNKDKLGVLKLKMMGFKVFFNQNFKVIFVKILINYLQVISLVQNFEINFPTFINPSIYFTMFFNQGLNTQFDCLLSKISNLEIHYIRMIWFLLFPLIYINLFFLLFGLIASFRKHTFNLGVISTTLLNVYGYFYPGLTQQLIQLLSYRSISGYKWIFSNVAYRFDKQTHLFWMLYFCLPLVTIIAIGIPMLLARILYKHKGNLDSQNVRANFGYLYNEYQKKSYFWEIQKIFQKEFISFAIIYFEGNIVSKFAVIFLALLIYEDISLRIKPYSEYRLNVLDSISTQICLLSFALSVGIYSSDKDQITYVSEVYKIIFLLSNIHFLIYLLLLITKEYLFSYMKQFYQTLDKIAITSIKHFPNQICLIKLRKYLDLQQKKEKRLQNYFIKLKSHLRKEAKKSILNKSELIKNIQEK